MLVFTTDAVYQNIFTYVKIFLFMFGISLIDVWCFSLFACNIEYAKVTIVRYSCIRTFVPQICYDGLSIHLETDATRGIVFNITTSVYVINCMILQTAPSKSHLHSVERYKGLFDILLKFTVSRNKLFSSFVSCTLH